MPRRMRFPPIPVLVGFRVRNGLSLFTVADVGIGVYESLRNIPPMRASNACTSYPASRLHNGVSSIEPDQHRGFGFREVFKAILSCDGMLRFRSGADVLHRNERGQP